MKQDDLYHLARIFLLVDSNTATDEHHSDQIIESLDYLIERNKWSHYKTLKEMLIGYDIDEFAHQYNFIVHYDGDMNCPASSENILHNYQGNTPLPTFLLMCNIYGKNIDKTHRVLQHLYKNKLDLNYFYYIAPWGPITLTSQASTLVQISTVNFLLNLGVDLELQSPTGVCTRDFILDRCQVYPKICDMVRSYSELKKIGFILDTAPSRILQKI